MSAIGPMLPMLAAACLAGLGSFALFHGLFLAKPDWGDVVSSRLRLVDGALAEASKGDEWSNPKEILRSMTEVLDKPLKRNARGKKLSESLTQADLKIKTVEWLMIVVLVSCVLAGLLFIRFGTPIVLPVGLVAGWLLCGFYLSFRVRRRQKAFANQLSDTIVLLSNALKAGFSFGQAIQTVADAASPPISTEFSRTARELGYGVPMDDALQHLVARNQSDDLDLVCTAVQIHHVVGGNLSEILESIAYTIRERVRIKGVIKTLTAQARASGWIVICLPPGLAAVLSVISPNYFGPMLHSGIGNAMLAAVGFFEFVGYMVMRKIVAIEV